MELGGRETNEDDSLSNSFKEREEEQEDEDDDDDKMVDHKEKATASRIPYYECTFCKRGFTNAQALGGHMNIHRKDKSKAPKPKLPKSKQSPNQDYMNKNFPIAQISPQNPISCATFGSGESSFMFYHSSPLTSSLHTSNPNEPMDYLGFHGGNDHPGFNLNLQIGSSVTRVYDDLDEEIKDVDEGDTVDLELRLGRPSPL